jgi:hypothetical protein
VVVYSVDFQPIDRQFFIAILIVLTILRVNWLMDSDLVWKILLGYDLDKSLTLQQNAWSIMNMFSDSPRGSNKSSKIAIYESGISGAVVGDVYQKQLARFAKSKNQEELMDEITRTKADLESIQKYLIALENMRFASGGSGGSSTDHSNLNGTNSKGPNYHSEHEAPAHPDRVISISPVTPIGDDPHCQEKSVHFATLHSDQPFSQQYAV